MLRHYSVYSLKLQFYFDIISVTRYRRSFVPERNEEERGDKMQWISTRLLETHNSRSTDASFIHAHYVLFAFEVRSALARESIFRSNVWRLAANVTYRRGGKVTSKW